MTESPRRTVGLPFAWGETVYHRARATKVPGVVVGYRIYPVDIQICVRWGDDLCVCDHFFFELSTEHQPDFTAES